MARTHKEGLYLLKIAVRQSVVGKSGLVLPFSRAKALGIAQGLRAVKLGYNAACEHEASLAPIGWGNKFSPAKKFRECGILVWRNLHNSANH